MKSINDTVVIDVAKQLIAKNGQTTNLDVKLELRSLGYFALQAAVAAIMDSQHSQNGLDFSYNGKYRVYVLSTSQDDDQDDSDGNTSFGGMSVIGVVSSTSKAGVVASYKDAVEVGTPHIGDWCVSNIYDNHSVFYEGNLPEYAVRRAYYKSYDYPFVDVRARRVR